MTDQLPFQQTEFGCRIEGAKWCEVRCGSASAGVRVTRSRRMPWLHEARVLRFGRGLTPTETEDLVRSFAALARDRPVLRLRVEALSERRTELEAVADACRGAGLRPAASRRSYARTAWVDLDPGEKAILASFHKTARQNIRAPGNKGLEVRSIVDPAAAGRVQQLLGESFARTGAVAPRVAWGELIEHGAAPSSSVRVAGLFRQEDEDSRDPLSFAVAYLHGDVAEYAHAGSVRDPSIRVSLLYAVAWELMRWAKSRGATAWDFGGITEASGDGSGDRRGGITDFKRYFSGRTVDVGEEWVLEPREGPVARLRSLVNPWWDL